MVPLQPNLEAMEAIDLSADWLVSVPEPPWERDGLERVQSAFEATSEAATLPLWGPLFELPLPALIHSGRGEGVVRPPIETSAETNATSAEGLEANSEAAVLPFRGPLFELPHRALIHSGRGEGVVSPPIETGEEVDATNAEGLEANPEAVTLSFRGPLFELPFRTLIHSSSSEGIVRSPIETGAEVDATNAGGGR